MDGQKTVEQVKQAFLHYLGIYCAKSKEDFRTEQQKEFWERIEKIEKTQTVISEEAFQILTREYKGLSL